MTTKEKIKILGSVFAAVLVVLLIGNGVLAVSSGDTTPPCKANRSPLRRLV